MQGSSSSSSSSSMVNRQILYDRVNTSNTSHHDHHPLDAAPPPHYATVTTKPPTKLLYHIPTPALLSAPIAPVLGETQVCSQCKDPQPISTFPVRLATLIPFRICQLHDWYWTEARKLTWAPATVSRIPDVVAAIRLRVTTDLKRGEEDGWVVVGSIEEMSGIVNTIAAEGKWKITRIPVRRSRSTVTPAPPKAHPYRMEPDAALLAAAPTGFASSESLKISLTHHADVNKFVITLKVDDPAAAGNKGWRKDRVGSTIKGESIDGIPKVGLKVKARVPRGRIQKRQGDAVQDCAQSKERDDANDEIAAAARVRSRAAEEQEQQATIHRLQELQRQLESGQPLPPPTPPPPAALLPVPVRAPIRRVAPQLIGQRSHLPALPSTIPASFSSAAAAAHQQNTSVLPQPPPKKRARLTTHPSTPSHALVNTLKHFLSHELDAMSSVIDPDLLNEPPRQSTSTQINIHLAAPSSSSSSSATRLARQQHAIFHSQSHPASSSSSSSAPALHHGDDAKHRRTSVFSASLLSRSPGRRANSALESDIDDLASPPAAVVAAAALIAMSPARGGRHFSYSPTNAGSSAIDTESEASEEEEESDNDGFVHSDDDGGYDGGFGGEEDCGDEEDDEDDDEGEEEDEEDEDPWLTGFVIGQLGGGGELDEEGAEMPVSHSH